MTKAIKFNLVLDKTPIRDLEDLVNHFNINELLDLYHNQLLERWLEVRGLSDELLKVKAINTNDDQELAKELCRIFHTNLSVDEIKSAIYQLSFCKEKEERLKRFEQNSFKKEEVIKDYHERYDLLIKQLTEKKDDYPYLKQSLNYIWDNYQKLFRLDFKRLLKIFMKDYPLIVFSLLAHKKFRESDLFTVVLRENVIELAPNPIKEGEIKRYQKNTGAQWEKVSNKEVLIKTFYNQSGSLKVKGKDGVEYEGDKANGSILNELYFYSTSYRSYDYIDYVEITRQKINKPFFTFSGITDGYWKDLEPKEKKYMILKMEEGNLIRSSDKRGEELRANDINGKFVILDGIDYKSNNTGHQLIYMEV